MSTVGKVDPTKAKVAGLTQEDLLRIWFETGPTQCSPYGLYGYPPMWLTAVTPQGVELYTRPVETLERSSPWEPWAKVSGVSYQFRYEGKWVGQGCQASFSYFEKHGASVVR